MSRRPREKKTKLLHRGEFLDLIVVGTVLFLGTLFAYLVALPAGEMYARSLAFSVMIVGQVLLIVSTLAQKGAKLARLFANRYLLPTMGIALGGYALLMYIPAAADYMRLIPLRPLDWIWIVGMAFLPFMVSEILKRKPLLRATARGGVAG